MSTLKPYKINQMIQDLNANPELREKFSVSPDVIYDAYHILPDEQRLLADGSIEAMTELGVHPNLQMKWIFISGRIRMSDGGPLDAFMDRLTSSTERAD